MSLSATRSLPDPSLRFVTALARRYTIERELGRGGMGTVYLAIDQKHARRVAIKVLPPDLAAAIGPERFLREIEIAARLTHPHILALHDSGQAAGFLYYVMPHVEGESLRARLNREGALPPADAVRIAAEVADALGYAHSEGVIHRDVKPENILLAGYPPAGQTPREWHAILADFGVARAATVGGVAAHLTETGLGVGTRGYSSPEQSSGSRNVDGRSDGYSLGCVLYEMLVGNRADSETSADRLLAGRFTEPLPPPSTLRAVVPEWLDEVVLRATAVNPAARFRSASDLRAALLGGAEGRPAKVARQPRRSIRWVVGGIIGAGLVAMAIASVSWGKETLDPKRVLVATFENRSRDPALDPVADIATDYLARGLATTRLMREVFDARTEDTLRGLSAVGAGRARVLARRLGAGTVVIGRYYRESDSLRFEVQLVDAGSGRILLSLEPVTGPLANRTHVVEALRQRVMAGLGTIFGPGFETWEARSVPPTYEAYRDMLAGTDALWEFEYDRAADLFRRAGAQDAGYSGARVALAYALSQIGGCGEVDSLAQTLRALRDPLPPLDQGQLDWATAECRGDQEGKLRAARTVLDQAPHSVTFTVLAAVTAWELFRPREALAILGRLDPKRTAMSRPQLSIYWDFVAGAYHDIGDFEGQLAATRAALVMVPKEPHLVVDEATALIGLGKQAAAESLAEGWLIDQGRGGAFNAGELAACVGFELRAHGGGQAGTELLDRVGTWYETHSVDPATADHFPCIWYLLSVPYYTNHLDQARDEYQRLAASDSENVKARAGLGAVAARRGDRDGVDRMDRWLASRSGTPPIVARARLAALIGDRDAAVGLLRAAFAKGLPGAKFVRLDPDFESLKDFPPFQELFRPRG